MNAITIVRSSRFFAVLPVAALLMLGACSDSSVTSPEDGVSIVKLTNAGELNDLLGDSEDRVMPFLKAHTRRDDLVASLSTLSNALDKGNAVPVESALRNANAALDRYEAVVAGDDGMMADLDAVRLTLNVITAQLVVDAVSK